MDNNKIKAYISDFLNDTIDYSEHLEFIRLFSGKSNVDLSMPPHYSCNDYIEKFNFYPHKANCIELTIEPSTNNVLEMVLVDNIEYQDKDMFIDGEPLIIRFFTLQSDNETRFFTAMGTQYKFVHLGPPTEHLKEDFLHLLDNHHQLQDNPIYKVS